VNIKIIRTDNQIFFSILTVKCNMSVHRSPVSKIKIVTNDYAVLFQPYLERFPKSSLSFPLHSYLNKRADINKYKNINIPRFIIGLIESDKVYTIFLNFSQSLISLKILRSLNALIISKLELLPPLY
jgi:hypothetical protein